MKCRKEHAVLSSDLEAPIRAGRRIWAVVGDRLYPATIVAHSEREVTIEYDDGSNRTYSAEDLDERQPLSFIWHQIVKDTVSN